MYDILKKINGPEDVKKLNAGELEALAADIREGLFNRLTKIGGHFGPNFGFVEAAIALHYVFNSPKDKFVFDVSHQAYAHKMLTGRKAGYIDDAHFMEDSGYTNPEESEHDFFNVGHTSTSVSLACGLAKARDLKGDKENIIANSIDIISPMLHDNRKCIDFLIFSYIPRPSLIALTIVAKLSSASIISEAFLATSVPPIPIEHPISAAFRAGASFTPSPVIATTCLLCCNAFTIRTL